MNNTVFIDGSSGKLYKATSNGREYRWTYCERFGPLFLKSDEHTPLKNIPSSENKIWDKFKEIMENEEK